MKHKFLLLALFTSIMYANAFAQPVLRGQKTIGGKNTDALSSIYLTNDGGLIMGGSSRSNKFGKKTENSRGGTDYWVVELNSAERISWDKTIGGSSDDYCTSVQQTSDGGYIVGGYSYSNISGEKTEDTRGSDFRPDYWIVKLDSDGKIQWDKTIGGNDYEELRSLQQTGDGGYILGGRSYSNTSYEKTENSRGGADYWIVKLNSAGKISWDKTIGGSADDGLTSLQQTSDGGYILGGYSYSNASGEKTENSRGESDYWIVKLDGAGNVLWDKTIGGSSDDALASLRQTSDDGYILGGYSYSNISGEKTQNSRSQMDYWVVKLNSQGNIQWDKTIGGSDYDELHSLQQTKGGKYILGGASSSNQSGEKTENSRGNSDYWVVELNKNGEVEWDKTIGGSASDECFSIKEIARNHYFVGGTSWSRISGDKTARLRGHSDYWLMKLAYIKKSSFEITRLHNENNIAAQKINNSNFTIYPIPAKDVLHVQVKGRTTVSLINQSGKILLTKTITGGDIINIANLKPGLYYLKNTATGTVQKVIVGR